MVQSSVIILLAIGVLDATCGTHCPFPGLTTYAQRWHGSKSEDSAATWQNRRSFDSGEQFEFDCPRKSQVPDQKMIIVCQSDGTWSATLPRCGEFIFKFKKIGWNNNLVNRQADSHPRFAYRTLGPSRRNVSAEDQRQLHRTGSITPLQHFCVDRNRPARLLRRNSPLWVEHLSSLPVKPRYNGRSFHEGSDIAVENVTLDGSSCTKVTDVNQQDANESAFSCQNPVPEVLHTIDVHLTDEAALFRASVYINEGKHRRFCLRKLLRLLPALNVLKESGTFF